MKNWFIPLLLFLILFACAKSPKTALVVVEPHRQEAQIAAEIFEPGTVEIVALSNSFFQEKLAGYSRILDSPSRKKRLGKNCQ